MPSKQGGNPIFFYNAAEGAPNIGFTIFGKIPSIAMNTTNNYSSFI